MQRSDVLTGLSIRLGPALKIYERHVKVLQRTHFLEYEDLWSCASPDRQTMLRWPKSACSVLFHLDPTTHLHIHYMQRVSGWEGCGGFNFHCENDQKLKDSHPTSHHGLWFSFHPCGCSMALLREWAATFRVYFKVEEQWPFCKSKRWIIQPLKGTKSCTKWTTCGLMYPQRRDSVVSSTRKHWLAVAPCIFPSVSIMKTSVCLETVSHIDKHTAHLLCFFLLSYDELKCHHQMSSECGGSQINLHPMSPVWLLTGLCLQHLCNTEIEPIWYFTTCWQGNMFRFSPLFLPYLNLSVVQLNTIAFWGTITGVTRKSAA